MAVSRNYTRVGFNHSGTLLEKKKKKKETWKISSRDVFPCVSFRFRAKIKSKLGLIDDEV